MNDKPLFTDPSNVFRNPNANAFPISAKAVKRGFLAVLLIWLAWAFFCLCVMGGLIYVAWHFISKIW